MFRPKSDFIFLELVKDTNLLMPDSIQPGSGDLFRILDVGPGQVNEHGVRIEPDVQKGDIVALVGKVLRIPYKGGEVLIARAQDVIAGETGEEYVK